MYNTYAEVIQDKEHIENQFISFYFSKEEIRKCSYAEIYRNAITLLGYMQKKNVKKGDYVILQVTNNYDFVHAIWACLLGGFIAIPVVCSDKELDKQRLKRIISGIEQVFIISSGEKSIIVNEEGVSENISEIFVITEAFQSGEVGVCAQLDADDLAMIQFSSGSTSEPKGVMLTHKNLLANITAIKNGIGVNKNDRIFIWIPLTHDMGLIGGHMVPTFAEIDQCLMEPSVFLREPLFYLQEVSRLKISILIMPNFGFQYILQSMRAMANPQFDFSSVRLVFNGAEPISLDVCQKFNQIMGKFQLSQTALFTVYGLAEATLAVAFPSLNSSLEYVWVDRHSIEMGQAVKCLEERQEESGIAVVSEGNILEGLECKICDQDGNELPQNVFGQILLKGTSIMKGYYRNEEMTKKKMTADGWLKTGDLGFVIENKLYVLGRQEELIIVNGQNYLSYDLENIIHTIPQLGNRKVAVLAVYHPDKKSDVMVCCVETLEDVENKQALFDLIKTTLLDTSGLLLESVMEIDNIPKTNSGKVKRFALKNQIEQELEKQHVAKKAEGHFEKKEEVSSSVKEIELQLSNICAELIPGFEPGDDWTEHQISSMMVTKLFSKIQEVYPDTIGIEELFKVQSLTALAMKINEYMGQEQVEEIKYVETKTSREVAIIGIGLHVPGASTTDDYWNNIIHGIESIGAFPKSRRKLVSDYCECLGNDFEHKLPIGGYIEDIELFDNQFFGILDREAIAMPPSQRLFLQTAYEAMEDAGYGGESLKDSKTGVFVGYISESDHKTYQEMLQKSSDSQTATGALAANISGRLSYTYNLRGESLNIDSACSSSGVALYHGYHSIQNGECDQAIIGGVQVTILPTTDEDIGIESKKGHIFTFDNQADGTCKGEGVVAVLLKSYEKAVRDRDHIYAVISSAAVNQDGRTKGLSVPNPDAQKELILDSLRKGGIAKEEIQYFEAHGTGTHIGDPIELNTLARVFTKKDSQEEVCYVGSVKPNIGHLYAASGLASVAKCCLMMEKKQIPSLTNFKTLNEKISLKNSSLLINQENVEWDHTRKGCMISNFGFSGTNSNILLTQPDRKQLDVQPQEGTQLFCLSAKSRKAFEQLIERYRRFTLSTKESLSDICFTALCGRGHYEYRVAILASSVEELHSKLMNYTGRIQYSEDVFVGRVCTFQEGSGNRMIKLSEVLKLNNLCKETMNQYQEEQNVSLLRKIAEFYVKGANTDWMPLFEQSNVRRVSLPTYCFDKKEFWPTYK